MSESANTLAIINQSAPYGSSNGQESLDMAMAMSNFAQEVSLFFIEDGVLQLLSNQAPLCINAKAYYRTFPALEFYDIENIYVCRQSLESRGIQTSELCIDITLIDLDELPTLLAKQKHVMSF